MSRLTDVVKNLLIINVLFFLGTMLMGSPDPETAMALVNQQIEGTAADWLRLRLALFYPTSPYFQPIQIVTHMFMHADFMHLFFNMFALFMFGPPLEIKWGPQRFLFYYLFTGFGAMGLQMFVRYLELQSGSISPYAANVPMLGASGAVFGILLGFGMNFPNVQIQLLFPPIPMKAKYFVMLFAGIELFLGFSNFNTGVAHFAHLGGALFGFLLILYWRKFGTRL